jgi:hypothetical protein
MEKLKDLLSVKVLAWIAAGLAVVLIFTAIVASTTKKLEPLPTITVTATPEPTITPEPSPTPDPTISVLYADCAAVWDALERPITKDDEGFPESSPNAFDLDADGIGCEDNPSTPEDESQIDWQAIWDKTKGNAEEFGDWAGPKLKDFWDGILAPSLTNTWDQIKERL